METHWGIVDMMELKYDMVQYPGYEHYLQGPLVLLSRSLSTGRR